MESKRFTRKQLQEQIGFDADKTQLILEYQKILPILMQDNDTWIDARDLWLQLGVKGEYSKWIKQQINDLELSESLDYSTTRLQSQIGNTSGFKEILQYSIKVSIAKEIAMIAGVKGGRTSKELIERSKIARKYFIYMEEAVNKNIKWEEIRSPQKEGFNKMCQVLDDYLQNTQSRNIDKWDRIYESNAINIICTGFTASEIRNYLNCKDKITRDSLISVYNEYISKMQEINIMYIGMGMNRYQRCVMLSKSFESLFPDAKPLVENIDVAKIIENKIKFLEEIKNKAKDNTLPFGLSA